MERSSYVVRRSDARTFRVDDSMKIAEYFDQEASPAASFVVATLNGEHSRRVNRRSDKLYFVIHGTGVFRLEDEVFAVERGDTVLVPMNVWHSFSGAGLEVAIIVAPGFREQDEQIPD